MKPFAIASILGLAIVSGHAAPASAQALAGTAWNAIEVAGTAVTAKGDRRPHLIFGADGRVAGTDGCNRLDGSYTAKGESISFGPLAMTQMACPGIDEIATRFRSLLKGTGQWRLADGRLEFRDATGKTLAVFEPRPVAKS